MTERVKQGLERWAAEHGLLLTDSQWGRLEKLVGLWAHYGRAMNLTGAREADGLVAHVQDGLQAVVAARRAGVGEGPEMRWVDVGSGAGMPGLIVAAVTEAEVILAEPRQRRAAFLEFAGRALGCGQMRVWRARWDGSTWDERGVDREIRGDSHEFSVASSRAVWGPSEWLKVGRKLIGVNGAVVVHCPHVSKLPGNRGWSGVTEPVGGKLGVVVAFRK